METYKDHITLTPDMNEERLNTLRELFPDWFTQEGYLDINEVKKAVNPDSVEETERYEFRWFGKSAAKRNAFTPTRATLHYDAGRSVNADTTVNIIIEGENLEVLKILSSSYRGKVNNQQDIFDSQLSKYVNTEECKVAILNALPIFLFDYFGKKIVSDKEESC